MAKDVSGKNIDPSNRKRPAEILAGRFFFQKLPYCQTFMIPPIIAKHTIQ